MLITLVILALVLQIAIALAVYFRRHAGHTNVIFMLLSIALAGWAFTNFVAITIPQNDQTIYAIRAVIGLVVIQNSLFYLFAKTFSGSKVSQLPKYDRYIILYSLFVLLLTQSPFVFETVTIKNLTANPNPGPAIIFFISHAVFTIGFGLRSLIRQHHRSRGQQRVQLRFIVFASVILWLIVPITNFVITLSAQTTLFVKASPFYTLLFGLFITYAMVAQKLFDVRVAVARALAYILSLSTVVALYATTAFVVADQLFSGVVSLGGQRAYYVGLAVISSLFYARIKRFFDRVTNRIFFQDAYDTQTFLDQLNNVLTSTIELEVLLRKSSEVIEQNLTSSFCVFSIHEGKDLTTVSKGQHSLNTDSFKEMEELCSSIQQRVIVADLLDTRHRHLKTFLSHHAVAIIVRLTSSYSSSGTVGYLILGYKNSGNPYTNQDTRNIDIIADELVIAIQNSLRFEEIQAFNASLQEKINVATRQMRHTNEKLKALDETKDEFISMASHQLRTPLTSVKGYLSMVLEGDAGKITPAQRKLLDQAFVSSQRMVYLIADLLNVSRLRTGKFIIEAVPSNLADVVQGEVDQLTETAAARGLELTYEKPEGFPVLMLDETKIRQVIMNFADNAIYYTPKGGHIKVELKDLDSSVEFTVTDDGLGVPKAEQHHLFNKFYRAGNARKARPDGTGLGLFMAKKVIVAQGGSIIFKSQEGKGSTFGFSFPKAKLLPPKIEPAQESV